MVELTDDKGFDRRSVLEQSVALAARHGLSDVEVYRKAGRSRFFAAEWCPGEGDDGAVSHHVRDRHEAGWAIRYGNKRGHGFVCGSGEPVESPALVAPRGGRLMLPQTPGPEPPVEPPSALISETQALRGLAGLSEALPAPLIERKLQLQDGRAASLLGNNHGLSATWFHRTSLLTLQESLRGGAVLRLTTAGVSAAEVLAIATRQWPSLVTQAYRVRWRPGAVAPSGEREEPTVVDGDVSGSPETGTGRSPDGAAEGERAGVVMTPDAAAVQVVDALFAWASATHGESVASPLVQVCDAPDWPESPLSATVDGEGELAVRRTLVLRGQLVAGLADAEVTIVRRGWKEWADASGLFGSGGQLSQPIGMFGSPLTSSPTRSPSRSS